MDDVELKRHTLHDNIKAGDWPAMARSIHLHCAILPICAVKLVISRDAALELANLIDPPPAKPHVPRLHLDMPVDATGEVHPGPVIQNAFPQDPYGETPSPISGPVFVVAMGALSFIAGAIVFADWVWRQ